MINEDRQRKLFREWFGEELDSTPPIEENDFLPPPPGWNVPTLPRPTDYFHGRVATPVKGDYLT